MQLVRTMRVTNALGLHARPAAVLAKLLQGVRSSVSLTYHQETADARSILSVLMLAVAKDGFITVAVDGEDAQEVMEKIAFAFETEFGEQE